MTILDSNVWIALFHNQDSQHAKAEKIFFSLTQKILIPEYVILEVSSVLLLKSNKEIADAFLERVIDSEDVEVALSNELFFLDVVKTFQSYPKHDLSFIDCALLLLSQSHTIITLDEHLARAIKQNQ